MRYASCSHLLFVASMCLPSTTKGTISICTVAYNILQHSPSTYDISSPSRSARRRKKSSDRLGALCHPQARPTDQTASIPSSLAPAFVFPFMDGIAMICLDSHVFYPEGDRNSLSLAT